MHSWSQRTNICHIDSVSLLIISINPFVPKVRMTLETKYPSNAQGVRVESLHRTQHKDRRSKLEIYHDILLATNESIDNGTAKPTHVQFRSNMSYGNLMKYLKELEEKNLINMNPLFITEKGMRFLNDFGKIKDIIQKIGSDYF